MKLKEKSMKVQNVRSCLNFFRKFQGHKFKQLLHEKDKHTQ